MTICWLNKCLLFRHQLSHCLSYSCRQLSEVRVRFGPSPTGFIHLGGLRTAFYNYLFAKQTNGAFILRIEDTDQERVVSGSLENLEEILLWTGLTPDEGPSAGGQYGPYIQSQRIELYREKINELLSTDAVYRCFCSPLRLDLLRKEKIKNREIPKYDNKCRHLTADEINDKLSNGEPFTVRLKLTLGEVSYDDQVFGRLAFDLSATEADPIIFKSDGFPTYHFANVVDDHYMKITHVLRGAEWQISTPKHLMLYQAFGWKPPVFAHIPLILNKDGSKLSKRQNDIKIDFYKEKGFYSETILNYLSTIGSGFGDRPQNSMDKLEDLIKAFDVKDLNVNNCKIDVEKLKLFNRFCIQWYLDNGFENKLIEELKTLLINKFGSNEGLNLDNNYLKFLISWSKDRIFTLKDLLGKDFVYLWKVPDFDWEVTKVGTKEEIEFVLQSNIELFENFNESKEFNKNIILEEIKTNFNEKHSKNMKFKTFMKILRLSVSNVESGSPIAETLVLLGRQKTIDYLKNAYNYVNSNPIHAKQQTFQ